MNNMAVAAVKNEYMYAPSRVYSHSRAAVAEALPNETPVRGMPRPRSETGEQMMARRAALSKTRVQHIGVEEAKKRRRAAIVKLGSVVLVFVTAAAIIAVLSRYSRISNEYTKINRLNAEIKQKEQNIAMLNVQLNAAVSLEEAQDEAAVAGLGYPTAAQIIKVPGTLPVVISMDDPGGINMTH